MFELKIYNRIQSVVFKLLVFGNINEFSKRVYLRGKIYLVFNTLQIIIINYQIT